MEDVAKKLQKLIEKLFEIEIEPEVTLAPEESGADYASNAALKLAGRLHKSPMEIAEEIRAEWEKVEGVGDSGAGGERGEAKSDKGGEVAESGGATPEVEVAKPGFLNFISPDEYYVSSLERVNRGEMFAELANSISLGEYLNKTVIVEFSDPNPFKVLHVGHLYTSVVGDCLARLMEVAGAKVIRANFGGDVGMHVAKNMYVILQRREEMEELAELADGGASEVAPGSAAERNSDAEALGQRRAEFMAKCYVEGAREYEEDETAHEKIVRLNKIIYAIAERGKLGEAESFTGLRTPGDKFYDEELEVANGAVLTLREVAEIYWRCREWSYDYFKDFYARIGLKFDKYYPESTVAKKGLEAVQKELKAGVYEMSDGAVVFKGEKYGLHTRVFINQEGLPTYEAKDVGLILTKWEDYHFDKSVIITGNDIKDYMKVVLKSIEQWAPELPLRTLHLTHGNVKLAGGVKMSSRKGNFLKAVEVLDLAAGVLEEEYGSKDERVMLAAVKYAFLKSKVGADTIFDPKESVSMTGNAGPYLQYATVRGKKIVAGAGGTGFGGTGSSRHGDFSWQLNAYERKLAKLVCQYEDVLRVVVAELAPQKLCAYLYELAQEFSRFYENVKVAGSEFEAERRELVAAYVAVMEHGLGLLGIEVPEEM